MNSSLLFTVRAMLLRSIVLMGLLASLLVGTAGPAASQDTGDRFVTVANSSAGWVVQDGERQWLNPECRTTLEANGIAFQLVSWSAVLAPTTTTDSQRTCDQLTPVDTGYRLVRTSQDADGWLLTATTRQWLSEACMTSLLPRSPSAATWRDVSHLQEQLPGVPCNQIDGLLEGVDPSSSPAAIAHVQVSDNHYVLLAYADGRKTRQWINAPCAAQLAGPLQSRLEFWAWVSTFEKVAANEACDHLLGYASLPVINPAARRVFSGDTSDRSDNLATNANGDMAVFDHDGHVYLAHAETMQVERISQTHGDVEGVDISADGRWVVYSQEVPLGMFNRLRYALHLFDSKLNSTRVLEGDFRNQRKNPTISDDGRVIAYEELQTFPTATVHIDVLNITNSGITRLSVDRDGFDANGNSALPVISGDGTRVIFRTRATNIGGGQNSQNKLVWVDLVSGERTVLPGTAASYTRGLYDISADGNLVTYRRYSGAQAPALTVYDIPTATARDLTERVDGSISLTGDGSLVTVFGESPSGLNIVDTSTGAIRALDQSVGLRSDRLSTAVAMSSDGTRLWIMGRDQMLAGTVSPTFPAWALLVVDL